MVWKKKKRQYEIVQLTFWLPTSVLVGWHKVWACVPWIYLVHVL